MFSAQAGLELVVPTLPVELVELDNLLTGSTATGGHIFDITESVLLISGRPIIGCGSVTSATLLGMTCPRNFNVFQCYSMVFNVFAGKHIGKNH